MSNGYIGKESLHGEAPHSLCTHAVGRRGARNRRGSATSISLRYSSRSSRSTSHCTKYMSRRRRVQINGNCNRGPKAQTSGLLSSSILGVVPCNKIPRYYSEYTPSLIGY